MCFFSSFSDGVAGVGVSEGDFIVITAGPPASKLIETMIAVGSDERVSCKTLAGDTHLASTEVGAVCQSGCDRRPVVGINRSLPPSNFKRNRSLCQARRMTSMSDLSPNGY